MKPTPAMHLSSEQRSRALPARSSAERAATRQRAFVNDRRPAAGRLVQLAAILNPPASDLSAGAAAGSSGTGLPAGLKAGVEQLSGHSLDDVTVHRNSPKPAQLRALAYAQGSEIHLGPGQEKHLAHEAWHVVQQKQGRVRPTIQAKSVPINDDAALEAEADTMGTRAVHHGSSHGTAQRRAVSLPSKAGTVQRYLVRAGTGSTSVHLTATDLRADSRWARLNEYQQADLLARLHDPAETMSLESAIAATSITWTDRVAAAYRGRGEVPARLRPYFMARAATEASESRALVPASSARGGSSTGAAAERGSGPAASPADEFFITPHLRHPAIRERMTALYRGHRADLWRGFGVVPQLAWSSPERAYMFRAFDQSLGLLASPMAAMDGVQFVMQRFARDHMLEGIQLGPEAFARAFLPEMVDDQLRSLGAHGMNAVAAYAVAYPFGGFAYERWFARGQARHFIERFLMRRFLRFPMMLATFATLTGATQLAHLEESREAAMLLRSKYPDAYDLLCSLNLEAVGAAAALRALQLMEEAHRRNPRDRPPPHVLRRLIDWIMSCAGMAAIDRLPRASDAARSVRAIEPPAPLRRPGLADFRQLDASTETYLRRMRGGAHLSAQVASRDWSVLARVPNVVYQAINIRPAQIQAVITELDLPADEIVAEVARQRASTVTQGALDTVFNAAAAYGIGRAVAAAGYRRVTGGAPRGRMEQWVVRGALRRPVSAAVFVGLNMLDVLGVVADRFAQEERLRRDHPRDHAVLVRHGVEHTVGPSLYRMRNRQARASSAPPGGSAASAPHAPPVQSLPPPPTPSASSYSGVDMLMFMP